MQKQNHYFNLNFNSDLLFIFSVKRESIDNEIPIALFDVSG